MFTPAADADSRYPLRYGGRRLKTHEALRARDDGVAAPTICATRCPEIARSSVDDRGTGGRALKIRGAAAAKLRLNMTRAPTGGSAVQCRCIVASKPPDT